MVKIRKYLSNEKGGILVYTLVVMLLIIAGFTSILIYRGSNQVSQNFELLDSSQKRDVLSLEEEVKRMDNLNLYETTSLNREMNGKKYSIEIIPTGDFTYKDVKHKLDLQWNQTKNAYHNTTARDPYAIGTDGTGAIQNLVGPRIRNIVPNSTNTHDSIVSFSDDYISQLSVLSYDGANSSFKPTTSQANKFRYRIDKGDWSPIFNYTGYVNATNTALTDPKFMSLLSSSPYGFISFEFFKGTKKVGWNRETLVSGNPSIGFQNGGFIVDNYYKSLNNNRGINQKVAREKSNLMYYISTLPNSADLVTSYSYKDMDTFTFIEAGNELNNLTSSEITTVMQLTYDRVCLGFKSVSPLSANHWSKQPNATAIHNKIKNDTIGYSAYNGSVCENNLNQNSLNYVGNLGAVSDGEDTIINGYSKIPVTELQPIMNFLNQSNGPGASNSANAGNVKLKTGLNAYEVLTGVDKPANVTFTHTSGSRPSYLSTLINAMGSNSGQYFNATDLAWVKNLANKVESTDYNILLKPNDTTMRGDKEYKSRLYCDDKYSEELSQYMSMIKYIEHRMKWLKTREDYIVYLKEKYDEFVATGTQPTTMTAEQFFTQEGWTNKGSTKGIERGPEDPPNLPCISDVNRETALTEFKEDELLTINLASAFVNNTDSTIEVKVNYAEDIEKAQSDWKMYYVDGAGNTLVAKKSNKDITNGSDTYTFSTNQSTPLTVNFKKNYNYFDLNKLNSESMKKGNTVPAYVNIITSNLKINSIEYTYQTVVGAKYKYTIANEKGEVVREGTLNLNR